MSANQLALAISVPANRIAAILRGDRAVSAETALRLGRYFGTGPEFWMNLQSRYDVSAIVSERGQLIEEKVPAASVVSAGPLRQRYPGRLAARWHHPAACGVAGGS